MNSTAIFWPMIAQVVLIYVIYLLISKRRLAAVRDGKAQAADFKLPFSEPEPSASAVRNLVNQYELPMLFLAVCLALQASNGVNYVALLLAWLFVASRIAHAFIHVTSNKLRLRRPLFIVGFFINGALWVWLALHLAMA